MPRYTLTNGVPKLVRTMTIDGMTIVNPSDEQVDQNSAGYPLEYTATPSFDDATQYLEQSWTEEATCIRETWTVKTKTAAMLIEDIDHQIAALNATFAALPQAVVQYPVDGRTYLLGWAREYYAPLLLKSDVEYPTPIADVNLTTQAKTKAELQALYDWLIAECESRITNINTHLATLYVRKAALEEN